ncbi:MAG: hypothetical protein AAFQ37_08205 [Bacteroidota bacterium]
MNFIRIYESFCQVELGLIKAAFQQAGLQFRTLHEHEIGHIYPHNPGLLSGALVEVAGPDVVRSKEVLRDLNIELDRDAKADQFSFIEQFAVATEQLFVIGQWEPALRLVALSFLALVALLGLAYMGIWWV